MTDAFRIETTLTTLESSSKGRRMASDKGKRKADGELLVAKVFDGSEPEAKLPRLTSPAPISPSSTPEQSTIKQEESAPKPASDIKILDFSDLKPDMLDIGARLETTSKNRAKFVSVKLKDPKVVIRSPKLCIQGLWPNDMGFTVKASVMGLSGDRKKGEPVAVDPKYPNTPQEELDERANSHDAALDLDEFFKDLLVKKSVEWLGKQLPREYVDKYWRPTMVSRQDEITGARYPPQFQFTASKTEDGKALFSIKDDTGQPIDPSTLILVQGGEKKKSMFCRVGFTVRRITFPNSGAYKYGLQLIAQTIRIFRGTGGAFDESYREVSIE